MDNEKWLPAFGFQGIYEVSSLGRVRSIRARRIMTPHLHRTGYLYIGLTKDGRRFLTTVHRIVATTHYPDEDHSLDVNHKDGDKLNNTPFNLEFCTRKHNVQHAHANGLCTNHGSAHHLSKLNEHDVLEVRRLNSEESMGCRRLSKMFGVSKQTIQQVVLRRIWKDL